MANKFVKDDVERIVAPSNEQERINFWIARGNALLEEQGKYHLHWVWSNGSYSIEPRPVAQRYIPQERAA